MRQFSFSLFATAMCAWATVSHAEQMLDVQGQYLFGDWQGKRTELAQKGITNKITRHHIKIRTQTQSPNFDTEPLFFKTLFNRKL